MVELKAMYGVAELARMAHMSVRSVEGLLLKAQVPINKSGKKKWIYLCDIKQCMPKFWESILDVGSIDGVCE